MKKRNSLTFRLALIFICFALLTIIASSVMTYVSKNEAYHRECEQSLRNITTYMSSLIQKEGMDFIYLEEYFKENFDKLDITFNYAKDIPVSKKAFLDYLAAHYPDRQFDNDLLYPELDDEAKLLYAKYRFEYWFSVFKEAADNFGLTYVYYIYPSDEEAHKVRYMLDTVQSPDSDWLSNDPLIIGDEVVNDTVEHKYLWEAWTKAVPPSGFDKINNQYGYVYTYCIPLIINGEKLGIICADIDVQYVESNILWSVLQSLLISTVVLVIGTIVISSIVKKFLIARIVRLEKNVRMYSDNKDPGLAEVISKQAGREDELGSLYTEFSGMITELDEHMKNLQAVTAEKERIGAELNVATNIQASMLPRIFPPFPERDDIDLYATMNPAKEVGGDFYDFFLTDDKHLAVVMADVSGKGVPAALIMVIAKTLIKNHLSAGESVEDAMMHSNAQLLENNDEMLFVTAWVGIIDLETGVVEFADAGHEPAFVLRQGQSVELIKHVKKKPPLATIEGTKYLRDEFKLEKGDTLFLYTDGVPEATNANEELFDKDRLEASLNEHVSEDPKSLLASVHADVNAFVGDAPQFDDLTMLAVKIK